jgi:hypothetical protein
MSAFPSSATVRATLPRFYLDVKIVSIVQFTLT